MSELPPLLRDQRQIDAQHLKLLAIFHFVGAGLAVLGLLFLLLHYTMFSMFFDNPKMWEGQKGTPPPAEFFAIFRWVYLIMAVWFVGFGVLNVLSGLFIRARKYRTFSILVGAFNCIHIPLGTILGVFTIVVLSRDSVQEVYDARNT